jgi:hypothetical protein
MIVQGGKQAIKQRRAQQWARRIMNQYPIGLHIPKRF